MHDENTVASWGASVKGSFCRFSRCLGRLPLLDPPIRRASFPEQQAHFKTWNGFNSPPPHSSANYYLVCARYKISDFYLNPSGGGRTIQQVVLISTDSDGIRYRINQLVPFDYLKNFVSIPNKCTPFNSLVICRKLASYYDVQLTPRFEVAM